VEFWCIIHRVIVQDADRLDAMRVGWNCKNVPNYDGFENRTIYHPTVQI
jgi:hypothetical protein